MTLLLGISGSLRQKSHNTGLLRAAQAALPAEDAQLELASIADIPFFNEDLESAAFPTSVVALKAAIAKADGLLLATPEYNNSLPGVLKNAIDWASRPGPEGQRVFKGKPIAIIGATSGSFGTILGQDAWMPVVRTLGMELWTGGRLLVSHAGTIFDEQGQLRDEKLRGQLADFVEGFVKWIGRG